MTAPDPATVAPWKLVASSEKAGIPQGVQYSPDGLCVLTSIGHELKIFNTPSFSVEDQKSAATKLKLQLSPALIIHGGDVVQSYDWYPFMDSQRPETCCFLGNSRHQPVHLYDAYTGARRASYCSLHPEREEPESAMVAQFSPDGASLVCGGFPSDRFLTLFDTNRPGREPITTWRYGKTKRSSDGQKGLVASLCFHQQQPHLMALGTYAPGSIYLYDSRIQGELFHGVPVVGCHQNMQSFNVDENLFSNAKAKWFKQRVVKGVTQLSFTGDYLLVAACRLSDAVVSFDVRQMTTATRTAAAQPIVGYKSYAVNHGSNQRLGFFINRMGHLYVGDRNNLVQKFDLITGELLETHRMSHTVNGVSLCGNQVAVALGERIFDDEDNLIQRGSLHLYLQ
jgi:WD40 repeat protein